MRIVLVAISAIFLGLAVLQLDDPDRVLWFSIYAAGALISGLTLLRSVPRYVNRLLAVSTMLLMFFYFFGFFELAPHLQSNWWGQERGHEALALLFSAFAMIPVLSCYSCRLKAICCSKDRRAPAVFSSPHPS